MFVSRRRFRVPVLGHESDARLINHGPRPTHGSLITPKRHPSRNMFASQHPPMTPARSRTRMPTSPREPERLPWCAPVRPVRKYTYRWPAPWPMAAPPASPPSVRMLFLSERPVLRRYSSSQHRTPQSLLAIVYSPPRTSQFSACRLPRTRLAPELVAEVPCDDERSRDRHAMYPGQTHPFPAGCAACRSRRDGGHRLPVHLSHRLNQVP